MDFYDRFAGGFPVDGPDIEHGRCRAEVGAYGAAVSGDRVNSGCWVGGKVSGEGNDFHGAVHRFCCQGCGDNGIHPDAEDCPGATGGESYVRGDSGECFRGLATAAC